jgi:hypothetical protein
MRAPTSTSSPSECTTASTATERASRLNVSSAEAHYGPRSSPSSGLRASGACPRRFRPRPRVRQNRRAPWPPPHREVALGRRAGKRDSRARRSHSSAWRRLERLSRFRVHTTENGGAQCRSRWAVDVLRLLATLPAPVLRRLERIDAQGWWREPRKGQHVVCRHEIGFAEDRFAQDHVCAEGLSIDFPCELPVGSAAGVWW